MIGRQHRAYKEQQREAEIRYQGIVAPSSVVADEQRCQIHRQNAAAQQGACCAAHVVQTLHDQGAGGTKGQYGHDQLRAALPHGGQVRGQ